MEIYSQDRLESERGFPKFVKSGGPASLCPVWAGARHRGRDFAQTLSSLPMKTAKALFLASLFAALAPAALAQDWQPDFEAAQAQARQDSLPIVLVFSGSDWCAPCIKLEREIWDAEEFQAYAKDHYVMLKADFPRRKANALGQEQAQANARLAETYNPQGFFPLVVVLSPDAAVLGRTGYTGASPREYIEALDGFLPRP